MRGRDLVGPMLSGVIDSLESGELSQDDPVRYAPIVASLRDYDPFMVVADFDAYWTAQRHVDTLWQDPARLVEIQHREHRPDGLVFVGPFHLRVRRRHLADADSTMKAAMNAPRALFIGHSYIDVTFLTDHIPTGDEKYVAQDYAVSFGGNAVTAAFCCAKLSAEVDLIATHADDWLGRMFLEMADRYSVHIHPRAVETSSLSFIMPNHGKRAIVRCRDDEYREPFPKLDVRPFAALHIDGHQSDAALYYAKACREAGILTSLDGGGVRSNTSELLKYIDVAVVSERFCEQMDMTAQKMLSHLRAQGCKVGGVTRGEHGLLWYEKDSPPRTTPALNVPPHRVIDTSGAGDVFHGAYVWSYLSHRKRSWAEHFRFASAASAFKIQKLGNEAGLPTLKDIENVTREFGDQVLEARPARENTSAMR